MPAMSCFRAQASYSQGLGEGSPSVGYSMIVRYGGRVCLPVNLLAWDTKPVELLVCPIWQFLHSHSTSAPF